MTRDSKADAKVIFALTLVHFIGDFYSSFVIPLLPVFAEKFALTLTQVGLLAGMTRLMAFVVQPTVGYMADRYRTRIFLLGGPFLAIVFLSLMGIVPGFWSLILCIALGSIGQSMYHPPCAGMVSTYAGPHFAFSMSIFNMGGTFAFGIGPIFIAYCVKSYGLEASPYTMVFGLVVLIYLFKVVPLPEGEGLSHLGFLGSMREAFGTVWKSIVILWIVMVLRAFTSQSFMTFIPMLYSKEGYSLVAVGAMVSLFTVAGAASGLLAGHLSDRFGHKMVFYASHSLATPCLFLLLFLPGYWVYVCAFLAGFLLLATLPLGVVMAQELAPRGKSMVSSLMMGLAFGTGGIMTPVTGKLADIFSIRPVLTSLAILPILTTGLIALIPGKDGRPS